MPPATAGGTPAVAKAMADRPAATKQPVLPRYFTLFVTNHGGAPFTPTVTNPATAVTNGLFNTTIDFGPGIFTGGSNWLELAVQTNGGSCFTTLAPRQLLTPVPYAITAAGLSGYLPFPPSSSPTARAA